MVKLVKLSSSIGEIFYRFEERQGRYFDFFR